MTIYFVATVDFNPLCGLLLINHGHQQSLWGQNFPVFQLKCSKRKYVSFIYEDNMDYH